MFENASEATMDNDHKVQILLLGTNHLDLVKNVVKKLGWKWQLRQFVDADTLLAAISDGLTNIIICDHDAIKLLAEIVKHPKLHDDSIYTTVIGIKPNDQLVLLESDSVFDILEDPVTEWRIAKTLYNAAAQLASQQQIRSLQKSLKLQSQELHELNEIGIALSAEHDPDTLLNLILQKSRQITNSDAGSLYLVEKKPNVEPQDGDFFADKQLRFKLSHNDSIDASYNEFVMPIEKRSMAGYVGLTGQVLNIEDAYQIPSSAEFSHNRSFDEKMGYRTKSVLGIPMRTHKGEIIGVLQLINRKRSWDTMLSSPEVAEHEVVPFDDRCVNLASSLASQAAVSIENTRLYEEIKKLFEGFIRASVHAIEQRDPTTSGHSERVATLTVDLAKKIDRIQTGFYKNVHFSRLDIQQINYAALLHDFGKIGVREHILVKAKKLYPAQLEAIQFRFKFIKRALELQYSQQKVRFLLKKNREEAMAKISGIDSEFDSKLEEIDNFLEFIIQANEPRVLAEGGFDKLQEISRYVFEENGSREHYLSDNEVKLLSIAKGSLSDEERFEIESHVTHTFNFLSKIPWTSELKIVPDIAHAHHEKLDGSGYPQGLLNSDIPIQSKMMTIADIYDALTAWDRPYKKAVPVDRALQILQFEVNDGKIDPELYRMFLEAEVYKIVKRPQGA